MTVKEFIEWLQQHAQLDDEITWVDFHGSDEDYIHVGVEVVNGKRYISIS